MSYALSITWVGLYRIVFSSCRNSSSLIALISIAKRSFILKYSLLSSSILASDILHHIYKTVGNVRIELTAFATDDLA